MSLSVVIPVKNEENVIENTIKSFDKSDPLYLEGKVCLPSVKEGVDLSVEFGNFGRKYVLYRILVLS